MDESNTDLKDMMRKCVRLGQEEYQQKLDTAGDDDDDDDDDDDARLDTPS